MSVEEILREMVMIRQRMYDRLADPSSGESPQTKDAAKLELLDAQLQLAVHLEER